MKIFRMSLRWGRAVLVLLLVLLGLSSYAVYQNKDLLLFLRKSLGFETLIVLESDRENALGHPRTMDDFPLLSAHFAHSNLSKPGESTPSYQKHNNEQLLALAACLEDRKNCTSPRQDQIAIFGAKWVTRGVLEDWRGGEGVWGNSMYQSLTRQGYTCLLGSNSWRESIYYNSLVGPLITAIVQENVDICYIDGDCVKTTENLGGIPMWKMFHMNFYPGTADRVMGGKWWVTAERSYDPKIIPSMHYLGYSMEDETSDYPVIPLSERRKRAYILAKKARYITHSPAWPQDFFTNATRDLGVEFVGGFVDEPWDWKQAGRTVVEDIENFGGNLDPTRFRNELGVSKILIGLGEPKDSPSPWVGLSMGVPFLNPIPRSANMSDCHTHGSQHASAQCVGRPYVYNVHTNDYKGFKEAIQSALETEITRYIPEWMTEKAMDERMRNLMTEDWETLGRKKLDSISRKSYRQASLKRVLLVAAASQGEPER